MGRCGGAERFVGVIHELRLGGGSKPAVFRKWKTLHMAECFPRDMVGAGGGG